jgi:hypothetical protein
MGVNERQAMGNKKPSQNWDDVRYFLAVARAGTLSGAAKQLDTEHTTVARHIQALEDELNNHLFHKSNSGYGLTDAGERLLAEPERSKAHVCAKGGCSGEGGAAVKESGPLGRFASTHPMGLGTSFGHHVRGHSLTAVPGSKSRF